MCGNILLQAITFFEGGDAVKKKTYFAFRVDVWDGAGDNIVEHVAGVDDLETAVATYWAAVRRWPKSKITLRQGARIVQKLARTRSPAGAGLGLLLESR
jgi:hypothetical protein